MYTSDTKIMFSSKCDFVPNSKANKKSSGLLYYKDELILLRFRCECFKYFKYPKIICYIENMVTTNAFIA